ncbi:hypothetical protein [Longimicrobium sp.]|uniref:hypothetical protein n=1 Tax=Longimicrobium sp. TaxID=2029185 RepID=UPI002C86EB8D|nr:hypothetical protein [Longimicrobium sp.]HSU14600.1 hypothetical protein [Longimicrobium sp.]
MTEKPESPVPPRAASPPPDAAPADAPKPSPVRPEPSAAEEEMGGEAPCQLHRFWDVPE